MRRLGEHGDHQSSVRLLSFNDLSNNCRTHSTRSCVRTGANAWVKMSSLRRRISVPYSQESEDRCFRLVRRYPWRTSGMISLPTEATYGHASLQQLLRFPYMRLMGPGYENCLNLSLGGLGLIFLAKPRHTRDGENIPFRKPIHRFRLDCPGLRFKISRNSAICPFSPSRSGPLPHLSIPQEWRAKASHTASGSISIITSDDPGAWTLW